MEAADRLSALCLGWSRPGPPAAQRQGWRPCSTVERTGAGLVKIAPRVVAHCATGSALWAPGVQVKAPSDSFAASAGTQKIILSSLVSPSFPQCGNLMRRRASSRRGSGAGLEAAKRRDLLHRVLHAGTSCSVSKCILTLRSWSLTDLEVFLKTNCRKHILKIDHGGRHGT